MLMGVQLDIVLAEVFGQPCLAQLAAHRTPTPSARLSIRTLPSEPWFWDAGWLSGSADAVALEHLRLERQDVRVF